MKKTFAINNIQYTVIDCTAIAFCDLEDGKRQNALKVISHRNGETFEKVVFGYQMPETAEDFSAMCEDSFAWESDAECLRTVEL